MSRFGPVNGPDMAEWCDYLRDDNAIHLDPAAAEAAGFSARVNPGPANLAYVLSALMKAAPEAEFARIEAAFHGNVLEGDILEIRRTDTGAELMRGTDKVMSVAVTLKEASE